MAFTVVNTNQGMPRLIRGDAFPLGALAANNQCVQFSFGLCADSTLRRLVITLDGNLSPVTNLVLECSLDGSRWFVVPPIASDLNITSVPDAAAAAVVRYDVSGLGGMVFRFGTTAYTSGSSNVWVQVD
jgi:hypothetical protein